MGTPSSPAERTVGSRGTRPRKGSPSFESVRSRKEIKLLTRENVDLIYNEKKGQLLLNANGAEPGLGDTQEGGLLAVLKGGPSLTLADIAII